MILPLPAHRGTSPARRWLSDALTVRHWAVSLRPKRARLRRHETSCNVPSKRVVRHPRPAGKTANHPGGTAAARGYFVVAVLIGGILGLSLANAVFVDEMTIDNTRTLEAQVAELTAELRALRAATLARGGPAEAAANEPQRHPEQHPGGRKNPIAEVAVPPKN